jgi:hypothetical protein
MSAPQRRPSADLSDRQPLVDAFDQAGHTWENLAALQPTHFEHRGLAQRSPEVAVHRDTDSHRGPIRRRASPSLLQDDAVSCQK